MPGPRTFRRRPLLLCHPVSPHTVGRGLDPSAERRGRRPLQRWPETIPAPMHVRGGLRAGRPTIFRSPPVRAGHARPATSPPPAVTLPPLTHSPNHLTLQPAYHPPPHNLCPPTAITPIYTLTKLLPQTLSKKSKNLQKPVDKGHTTCYNNQAVSRAQPAAAAAGAFTYSLYTVF